MERIASGNDLISEKGEGFLDGGMEGDRVLTAGMMARMVAA